MHTESIHKPYSVTDKRAKSIKALRRTKIKRMHEDYSENEQSFNCKLIFASLEKIINGNIGKLDAVCVF
jgi:hypothetical protein